MVPIPDHVPYAAAALAEPLSCCLSGQEAVGVRRDDVVLIIGAGPIGVMHLLLARLSGGGAGFLACQQPGKAAPRARAAR